jgi:hypothetical protein
MSAGRKVITDNKDWGTPPKYVEAVKVFFDAQIDLDPCSNDWSIVKAKTEYRLPEQDGLKESWNYKKIFVNPPYGRDQQRGTNIKIWIHRCALAHKTYGSEVLALVPVAVNTAHWKQFIFGKARSVCFLADTRLRFLVSGADGGKGAPMACCMVYWGTNHDRFLKVFGKYGAVVPLDELQKRGHAHSNEEDEVLQSDLVPKISQSNFRYPAPKSNGNEQAILLDRTSTSSKIRSKTQPVSYSTSKRKKKNH